MKLSSRSLYFLASHSQRLLLLLLNMSIHSLIDHRHRRTSIPPLQQQSGVRDSHDRGLGPGAQQDLPEHCFHGSRVRRHLLQIEGDQSHL